MTTKTHRLRPRLYAAVALAAVGLLLAASPAFADTSRASAGPTIALTGLINGTTSPVTTTATNDGTQPTQTVSASPLISTLGGQNLINAGALTQVAQAQANGSSTACSGVTGAGGAITVGQPGQCSVSAGNGQVSVPGVLTANAIVASCGATSAPTTTGATQLVGVTAVGGAVSIPLSPAANTTITIPLVATLHLNTQVTNPDGSLSVTALKIDVLNLVGPPLQSIAIGQVRCGPNAKTSPIPSFPVAGLPIAGGIVALAGGAVYYRRRRAASQAAA